VRRGELAGIQVRDFDAQRCQQKLDVRAYPKKRPSPQAVHRWWNRQLESAGLVGRGVAHGLNMHLARHTVATELRRVAGIDAASQALGHADLNTTLAIYGHRDQTDLQVAMEAYARWLEKQREDEIVPPEADL
jgi:integrase